MDKLQSIKVNQCLRIRTRKFSVNAPFTFRVSRLDFLVLVVLATSVIEIRTVEFFTSLHEDVFYIQ